MSSLANQQQNLSFPGLLQVPGGITSTLQQVQDGNGNVTGLSLSSAGASVTTSDTAIVSENGTPLTGATPRLISDMFGDFPNVKDFGAVGDGLTDDTAAFIAATAANPTGIAVPAGSYKIIGTVTGVFYSFGTVTIVTGTVTSIQNASAAPINYAASTGSTLVGTITSGTGAAARTVASKLNDAINVKDFGAVGDGTTNDTAAIQNAINAANSAGGGSVYFDAKDYLISNAITLYSGISLIGFGAGQYPPAAYASDPGFDAINRTRLIADPSFPALTAMIKVVTPDSAEYTLQAVTVEGIMIDCNLEADYGLQVVSVKNSFFTNLLIYQPLLIGVIEDCLVPANTTGTAQAGGASTITLATASSTRDDLYAGLTISISSGTGSGLTRTISSYVGSTQIATVSPAWGISPDNTSVYLISGTGVTKGNNATQFNNWATVTVWAATPTQNTTVGWVQRGNPSNNVNQSVYTNCGCVVWHGDALQCINSDTNTYIGFRTYTFGKGVGVRLYGNNKNDAEFARQHCFINPVLGGLAATGTAQAGAAGTITLSSASSTSNLQYEGRLIRITSGTGSGQENIITTYNGTTKVATVIANWVTVPDATSIYAVYTGGANAETGVATDSADNGMYNYHTADGASRPIIGSQVRFTYSVAGDASFGWIPFVPTLTFATVGDLAVSYATQAGRYWRTGTTIKFVIQLTCTPTYTTASSTLRIGGLPYPCKAGVGLSFYPVTVHNSDTSWTFGGSATQVVGRVIPGVSYIQLQGLGSGINSINIGTTEVVSGSAKNFYISGEYEATA